VLQVGKFIPRPSLWKYYLLVFVIATIGRMPLHWRYGISRFLSDRIYRWRPSIRNACKANARQVLGPGATDKQVERVAHQMARNTGRYYADVVGMHRMDVQKFFHDDLILEGIEYINDARAAGRGVVMASAHYANPEFAAQGLAAIGIPLFGLVEPLNPPQVHKLMYDLRRVHGHRYEAVSLGAVKNALQWLRDGGIIAILIDRDIQKRGMNLELCGAVAPFPTGAVDLALRTNSLLVPAFVRRRSEYKIEVTIGPPLELQRTGNNGEDVRVNSQALLWRFEEWLRQDPGQWSVLERIWPAAQDAADEKAEQNETAAAS
jgi:KDO2-lipid IV(A) lauroyltransferase